MGRLRAWLCRLIGCTDELIIINMPVSGATISSPVSVSGVGQAAQHNQLFVEVRDASNTVIGSGPASITGPLGQRGPFSGSITFSPSTPGSPGHVQVYDTSPATGAVTHLASVLVRF
jgi:hypothetical protein